MVETREYVTGSIAVTLHNKILSVSVNRQTVFTTTNVEVVNVTIYEPVQKRAYVTATFTDGGIGMVGRFRYSVERVAAGVYYVRVWLWTKGLEHAYKKMRA